METELNNQMVLKMLVVGDSYVGKTCIIRRYTNNVFSDNYKSTIGVDFALKIVQKDDLQVRVQLWDIAGQERCRTMTRIYYKDAAAALVVLDVSNRDTWDGVLFWKRDIDDKFKTSSIPCMLVVNKCDLVTDDSVYDCFDKICNEHGFLGWIKTSAMDDIGVQNICDQLIDYVLENMKESDIEEPDIHDIVVVKDDVPKDKEDNCCGM